MRNPEEIKAHIRALKVLQVKPCDCHAIGPAHTFRCVSGGKMMQCTIEMLEWVLGSEKKAEFVATLNRAADEFTRGG